MAEIVIIDPNMQKVQKLSITSEQLAEIVASGQEINIDSLLIEVDGPINLQCEFKEIFDLNNHQMTIDAIKEFKENNDLQNHLSAYVAASKIIDIESVEQWIQWTDEHFIQSRKMTRFNRPTFEFALEKLDEYISSLQAAIPEHAKPMFSMLERAIDNEVFHENLMDEEFEAKEGLNNEICIFTR